MHRGKSRGGHGTSSPPPNLEFGDTNANYPQILSCSKFRAPCLHYTHTQCHTHTRFTAHWTLSWTTRVSRYQNHLILLKQETVSGSGISWAMCKSAPRPRQITMPAPHHSVFLQAGCLSCRPTNSVKALKATWQCSKMHCLS